MLSAHLPSRPHYCLRAEREQEQQTQNSRSLGVLGYSSNGRAGKTDSGEKESTLWQKGIGLQYLVKVHAQRFPSRLALRVVVRSLADAHGTVSESFAQTAKIVCGCVEDTAVVPDGCSKGKKKSISYLISVFFRCSELWFEYIPMSFGFCQLNRTCRS